MSPLYIYLAAPWSFRHRARVVASLLRAEGHTITSHWHDIEADTKDPETLQMEAMHDLSDIDEADILVLLNTETSEGKAVEFGYALAQGLLLMVVGERSNVFHYLPEVVVVPDLPAAIEAMRELPIPTTT
jgi:nucleoside 2-deoxyribosyltransferase